MTWAPKKHSEGYPMNYRMRISRNRGDVAIWGGLGVEAALTGTEGYIVVRVDERGEAVTVKKKPTAHTAAALVGVLKPGECYVVGIDNATAITASCATDSFIDCALVFKDA